MGLALGAGVQDVYMDGIPGYRRDYSLLPCLPTCGRAGSDNVTAKCEGDLDNFGRLFPFKIHSGVIRGGPETWAALCLRLVTANCLASEFQAESRTSVSNVEHLLHDKAP